MDNLKVPDNLRKDNNKEIQKVIGFLDVARSSSGRLQPFDLVQYMIDTVPNAVPDEIKRIFPISEDEFSSGGSCKIRDEAPSCNIDSDSPKGTVSVSVSSSESYNIKQILEYH
jgi:hypothetical protein